MFKKLRIKFIAITMVMVAIVMAFAFTVVCAVEYQRSYSVVQTALENAVDEAVISSDRARDRLGMMKADRPTGSSSTSSNASSDEGRSPSEDGAQPSAPDANLKTATREAEAPEESPQNGAAEPETAQAAREDTPNRSDTQPGGLKTPPWKLASDNGDGQNAQDASEIDGAQGNTADDTDDTSVTDESTASNDEDSSQPEPPRIGNRPGQQRPTSSLVPVAVYRTDSEGTLKMVPEITTASISEDVLQEATDLAMQAEAGFGTFSNLGLNYYKAERNAATYLAFADTSYTDSWKTLALILTGTGIGTLIVFFVVALFYSRWALRPVKEAWDSQRQFVADASHDLKTPLTVILANAAILLKHPDHTIASESQWIESTQKEAEEMQGLVNEMLELAQIEAGQQAETVRDPIDLSDLVDGETLMFDSVALERGCQFNCSIDENVTVLGDEKQVKKLVATLVENAFKYVDDTGTIDVTLRKAGKMATIAIHNTGSSISPEDLPHIFDRFYRTDKARTSGTGGFGLGLAIAREIALQHNGDITCQSTPTEGTTFTITLPAQ